MVIVGGLVAVYALFPPVPIVTHDNNYELWLNAFDQLIRTGKLFPDWIKAFSLGHGNPLFVFYPPLFFYLAEIPRLLGTNLVVAVKVIVAFSTLAAFFAMYLLAREFLGKWGGLTAGLLYMLAPYHLALIYVRGAYAENLAYALLPLLLFFIYRIFTKSNRWVTLGMAGTLGALIISNLPIVLMAGVMSLIFVVVLAVTMKRFPLTPLATGLLGGLGLSAFYWLPMVTSLPLIRIDNFAGPTYYFANEFVRPLELLRLLYWGRTDFFQIGLIAVILMVLYLWQLYRPTRAARPNLAPFLWVGAAALFLLLPLSYWIWKITPLLPYIQFPFRFLGILALALAIIGGAVLIVVKPWLRYILLAGLLAQSIWLARPPAGYRLPIYKQDVAYTVYGDIKAYLTTLPSDTINPTLEMHTADLGFLPQGVDKEKLKALAIPQIYPAITAWSLEQAAQYYLPIDRMITSAQATVITHVEDTQRGAEFDVTMPQEDILEYQQFNFPGWTVALDGGYKQPLASDYWLGLTIPAGQHHVKFEFTAVPGAVAARILSLITALILLVIGLLKSGKLGKSTGKPITHGKTRAQYKSR